MSLEVAIQENTEVMRELIAALKAGGVAQPSVTPPAAADTKPAEKQTTKASNKPAQVEKSADPEPQAETTSAPEASAQEESTSATTETEKAPTVTYDDVKKMALEVAKICGREELVRVLNSYGAKNATELKGEQYPQVLVTLETSLKTFQQKAA